MTPGLGTHWCPVTWFIQSLPSDVQECAIPVPTGPIYAQRQTMVDAGKCFAYVELRDVHVSVPRLIHPRIMCVGANSISSRKCIVSFAWERALANKGSLSKISILVCLWLSWSWAWIRKLFPRRCQPLPKRPAWTRKLAQIGKYSNSNRCELPTAKIRAVELKLNRLYLSPWKGVVIDITFA